MARESIVEDDSWMGSSKAVALAWSVWTVVAVLVTASVVAPPLHPDLVYFAPALLLVPFSIGIAIIRYRLYDIDVVINRSIAFAVWYRAR